MGRRGKGQIHSKNREDITIVKIKIENEGKRGDPMNEGYFVGWGTLALINAGIAQGKNRSGLNWFLVSLLLGPIATFLLVLFEKLPYSDE